MLRNSAFALVSTVLSTAATVGLAQGVNPDGPVESDYGPMYTTQWGGALGATVELDPAGPPWMKHFVWPDPSHPLQPGQTVTFSDSLVIGGQRSWDAWQGEVLAEGFKWFDGGGIWVNAVFLRDLTRELLPSPPGDRALRFSFDPLPPGTDVWIVRALVYTGTDPFSGTITIRDFPTPEPSTFSLAVAGAFAGFRRRRAK